MAIITKAMTFDAAHSLPGYLGKCANLHGHTYTVEIGVAAPIRPYQPEAPMAPDTGFVVDFADLSGILKALVARYCDHRFLNESLPIPRTTAEFIACWFYGALTTLLIEPLNGRTDLGERRFHLQWVRVEETATSAVIIDAADWESQGCWGRDATLDDR